MSENPVILLAEDSRSDVLLAQRAFRKLNAAYLLHVVENGDAAVSYLAGIGDYSDRDRYPLPVLLLLDLKMPRKSGFEVMEWLQQQPHLQLPVVVLTTSSGQDELDRAYSLGAKSYMFKPITLSTLSDILELV